jgi:pectate lyase
MERNAAARGMGNSFVLWIRSDEVLSRSSRVIGLAFAVLAVVSSSAHAVDGWASYPGDPNVPATYLAGGTTGGAAGLTVTVSNETDLRTYATSASPYVIKVQGTITLSSAVNMESNKTVIGVDTSSTIVGQINVSGKKNVIFRYLNITNSATGQDIFNIVSGTHHVWIDHCTIWDARDGCLDSTKGVDYLTYSWLKFYYTAYWGHNFTCLISSSDTDEGPYRITWHHNWWGAMCDQRQPNVKHGYSHIYNCYWSCTGNSYCTDVRLTSQLLSEHNYYDGVDDPLEKKTTGTPRLKTVNVVFNNCTGYQHTGNDTLDPIPYSYTLDPVANVPAIVTSATNGAGNTTQVVDNTAPTPDPMTWATAPYGANSTSITMVASAATDISGVEYFFDCTVGGGHDSAWQDSVTYTDTGLTQGVAYSYQVKARDKSANHNETGFSSVESASPTADTTAPTPDPMTWASDPAATGIDTIAMTATTATDASGVEYLFACTSGGGHDSGWQDSTSYTDTGLTNNTTYTYRVLSRDKSAGQNETGWSAEASATTIRFTCSGTLAMDFNADCKVDFMDYATIASAWGEEAGVVVDLIANGGFATDLSGWSTSIANPTLVQITWDAGTAKLARTVSNSTAPNGNYLYQVIPVVSGRQYQIAAQWKGDLTTTSTDRQWAEVYVGFVATGTPTSMGSIMYKKSTYGGVNTPTAPWDWASILLSPNTSPVPPAGGLFTATDSYMVVAFNIGGRASAGTCYYNVDNISVVEAGGSPCPSTDLNDDCAFDWLDIEVFAADWLACNRNPGSECLE